jgi:hypothetical protein
MMDTLFKRLGLFLLFTLVIGGRIWQFPRGFRRALEEVQLMEERNKPAYKKGFPARRPRHG